MISLYKKIFIGGPIRSGTTLVFNIINEIIENLNLNIEVIKGHRWDIEHQNKNSLYIVCCRNPYDSMISFLEIYDLPYNINNFKKACIEIEKGVKWALDNISETNFLFLNYNKFTNNYTYIFDFFEKKTDIKVTLELYNKIFHKFNINNVKKSISKFKSFQEYDTKNHFHGKHISKFNGNTKYKNILDSETITTIKSENPLFEKFIEEFKIYDYKDNFDIIIPYLNENEKKKVIDKRFFQFDNIILYEKSKIIENLKNIITFNKEHCKILDQILDNSINKNIKINNYYLGKVTDFAFLYHIIENYHYLNDYIIYSKAHQIQQGGGWDNFLNEMNNLDNYRQFGKINRQFITLNANDPITNKEIIRKYPGYKNVNNDCNMYVNESTNHVIFITRHSPRKFGKRILEKIFPDYKQKSNLNLTYFEGTFVVSKKIIQYHAIDTYKMILLEYLNICKDLHKNYNKNESKYNDSIHGDFTEFFHFFFTETMEKMF